MGLYGNVGWMKGGVTMNDMREANILKKRRGELGYTQLEIAVETGVDLRQYQRFEYGQQLVSNGNMKKGLRICAMLEIDPYEIAFEDGEDMAGIKKRK